MVINYPNGQLYENKEEHVSQQKKAKSFSFSNRGMSFEEMINKSNEYYLEKNIAVIHKKPTPVQIVKVDYPRRSAAVIKEAYFKQASTTDYNGVYKGHYIDFEAKETKNKTSFPLSNIHEHQISHMKQCTQQNGVAFLLIFFSQLKRCFLLEGPILFNCWDTQSNGKKSIPLDFLEKKAVEVEIAYAPQINYITALEKILG